MFNGIVRSPLVYYYFAYDIVALKKNLVYFQFRSTYRTILANSNRLYFKNESYYSLETEIRR